MNEHRESWSTSIGFILASAGSAVGLGNIWRFPYITGENGGGVFLLAYVMILAVLGLSVMLAEFTIGRAAKRNPIGAFTILKGGAWPLVGFLGVASAFIVLSFYSVVGGWTIAYVIYSITGEINITDPQALKSFFGNFISDPLQILMYHGLFMVATTSLVVLGINNGIQKACYFLMPLLFLLIVTLVLVSLNLEGSWEGVLFFFQPDLSKITPTIFTKALGQAFLSLSLGLGALLTYASYLDSKSNLPACVGWVISLDFLICILAGLVILPAVFAFGFQPDIGASLTFITLPAVFAQIPGTNIFAALFFALLFIAALTSAISLLEVVTAYAIDEHRMSRSRATVMLGIIIFLFGIPSALSFGVTSEYTLYDKTFFHWMELLATQIGLPLGGLLMALFVGWVIPERAKDEITSQGTVAFQLYPAWLIICRIIAPVAIGWILLSGLLGF